MHVYLKAVVVSDYAFKAKGEFVKRRRRASEVSLDSERMLLNVVLIQKFF